MNDNNDSNENNLFVKVCFYHHANGHSDIANVPKNNRGGNWITTAYIYSKFVSQKHASKAIEEKLLQCWEDHYALLWEIGGWWEEIESS